MSSTIQVFSVGYLLLLLLPFSFQQSQYNVEWTTPSPDVSGSMPLGNGVTAANIWAEVANSQLFLYSARQDAWDENANLLKLNQVQITFSPSLGLAKFKQTLDLSTSTVYIDIEGASPSLSLRIVGWIAATDDHIVVQVDSTASQQFFINVTSITWRTTETSLFDGGWYCSRRSTYPDVVVETLPPKFPGDSVVFYHRNDLTKDTFFYDNLKAQGLESITDKVYNPLLNRQFGAVIYGTSLKRVNATTLISPSPQSSYVVVITTHSNQTTDVTEWTTQIAQKMLDFSQIANLRKAHLSWWNSFWGRSHIFITPSTNTDGTSNKQNQADNTFIVSQQYALWRYLQASQGRSPFPIKFNGQLYVAEKGVNPDNRDWGGANWWQNARLSYWNMFISGDSDLLQSLFEYYLNMLPLALYRTQIYFNINGAFWPETQLIFGTYYDSDYGCNRNGLPTSIPDTRWNRYNYQGGLDLSMLILDHYTYFQDVTLFKRYLPIVTSVIEFYSRRWTTLDKQGKLILFPSQAIETWQCPTYPPITTDCVTNDMPDIAGLRAVLSRILALPPSFFTSDFLTTAHTLYSRIPDLPTALVKNETVFKAGAVLPGGTSNSENPELYTVHPYRLTQSNPSLLPIGINSYNHRQFRCNEGWCQDIMNAALLGLTNEAQTLVVQRATTAPASGYRFQAFMPHFQDYQPSSDHLSNMNSALNWMLLQGVESTEAEQISKRNQHDKAKQVGDILLFPAWPCNWNVDFKLQGPLGTIVEGQLLNQQLLNFVVTPPERKANVHFAACVKSVI